MLAIPGTLLRWCERFGVKLLVTPQITLPSEHGYSGKPDSIRKYELIKDRLWMQEKICINKMSPVDQILGKFHFIVKSVHWNI